MLKYILFILTFMVSSTCVLSQSKIDSLKSVLSQTTEKKEQLTILDNLTTALIRANDTKQESYLKEYLELTNELEEFDLMASKSRFLIQFYINKGQMDIAEQLSDSLLQYKEKFTKSSSEAHLLLKRAATYYEKESLDAAVDDYKRSAELFLKSGDSIYAADALFFGGQAFTNKNSFLEAIQYYQNAEKLYEALGDQQYALLVGAELTTLYGNNGFVEKSIQERALLIEKARKNNDYTLLAHLLGQNVAAYNKLKAYHKMQPIVEKMIQVKDSINNPYVVSYHEIFILNYQLVLACEKRNVKDATRYMQQLEEKTKENISPYLKIGVLDAKAAFYELTGNEEDLLVALKTLANIPNTSRLSTQTQAREKLIKILSK